jgi:mediator of RNA polymerase II transcription subunit 13
VPPKTVNFVSSSKYAPLTNLHSQTLPPITLPGNSFYKPSWIIKKEKEELQKLKESQENTSKGGTNNKENQNVNERLPVKQEVTNNQQPTNRPPYGSMKSMPGGGNLNPPGTGNNASIMSQILNSNNNNSAYHSNVTTPQQPQHSPHPHMAGKNMVRPPGMSPIAAVNSPYQNQFQPQTFGNIMHKSPHPSDLFKKQQLLMQQQQQQHSQPPPPYEVAVHSPALGFQANNRMMGMNMYNQQQTPINQNQASSMQHRTPEANSLLVNILLYDTSLNIFRDHNFDSCTLCVCNAGPNCVGNIRGADSGTYLSLTATCHFNENLLNVLENVQQQSEKIEHYDQLESIKFKNLNMYQNSPASSTSSVASPACGMNGQQSNQNTGGYLDEDPISCRCGFSAVMNRRLAYKNGLFYEDELEITGMPDDPAIYKKSPLMSIILKMEGDFKKMGISIKQEDGGEEAEKQIVKAKEELSANTIPLSLMDLLREQCSVIRNSSNSIQRAIAHHLSRKPNTILTESHVNLLEFVDAFDVVTLALEQSRLMNDKQDSSDGYANKMLISHQKRRSHANLKSISVHKWPYLYVDGPKGNKDIVRIMQTMQPLLQDAFHKKCTTRLWDAPYTVKGPLTWREFHRLAGRGTGQCEPQPIPSVIVGHDKDWLSVAPYAIHYWDKLLLEPYSYPRDVAYIVVAPDNNYIVSRMKFFFKELSTTYEMCRLGRHRPIKGWDGILRVGKNSKMDNHLDEWFQALGKSKVSDTLRMYGATFQQQLVPYLQKIPQDKSLLDPPEGYSFNASSSHHQKEKNLSLPSPMLPPHTPDGQQNTSSSSASGDKAPNTPKSSEQGIYII